MLKKKLGAEAKKENGKAICHNTKPELYFSQHKLVLFVGLIKFSNENLVFRKKVAINLIHV